MPQNRDPLKRGCFGLPGVRGGRPDGGAAKRTWAGSLVDKVCCEAPQQPLHRLRGRGSIRSRGGRQYLGSPSIRLEEHFECRRSVTQPRPVQSHRAVIARLSPPGLLSPSWPRSQARPDAEPRLGDATGVASELPSLLRGVSAVLTRRAMTRSRATVAQLVSKASFFRGTHRVQGVTLLSAPTERDHIASASLEWTANPPGWPGFDSGRDRQSACEDTARHETTGARICSERVRRWYATQAP